MIEAPENCDFLFHFLPPVGTGPSVLVLAGRAGAMPITAAELSSRSGTIATYSPHLVVEHCRAVAGAIPPLRDISTAVRLLAGRPKRSFGQQPLPWDMADALAVHVDDLAVRKGIARIVRGLPSGGGGVDTTMVERITLALKDLWERTARDLGREGELSRFLTIEDPVSRIFHRAQFRGIAFDKEASDLAFGRTDSAYYGALRRLKIDLGVDVENVWSDPHRLLDLLKAESETEIEDWPENSSSRDIVRHLRGTSSLCTSLYELWKLRDELRILTDVCASAEGRVYPVFDAVGTVTARATVRDPHLQNLTKRLRHLLVASPGKRLLYIDYGFFEPMIMAALADSAELKKVCREDDMYLFVARRAGYDGQREPFKLLFLGYSYGMGEDSLRRWAARLLGIDRAGAEAVVRAMVDSLADISVWKSSVHTALRRDGRVGTVMGNFRRREAEGDLTSPELRWSVSQVVQGSGSLILKRAILAIDADLGEQASLLLPLHDAALFEIDVDAPHALEQRIVELFELAARKVLPSSQARASIQEFAAPL